MEDYFLKVPKSYFKLCANKKLDGIDILILAQIEEFQNNNLSCFISNSFLADSTRGGCTNSKASD